MERHRYMYGLLKGTVQGKHVLDIAPYSPLIWKRCLLDAGAASVTSVDRWERGNPLDPRDVSFADEYCDIVDIVGRFGPASFDLVIMEQVLDEVLDYRRALSAVSGVLAGGGTALVEVRVYWDIDGARSDVNRQFGDYWKFGQKHLLEVIGDSFSSVEFTEYNECGWTGHLFACG